MYRSEEMAKERQRSMLASATAERQARRVTALCRADRRAERAQRQLARSWSQVMRLRGELAAEQRS